MKMITEDKVPASWEKAQHDKYGHVFVTKAWLNQDRLSTSDPKALHHVLTNSMIYKKPEELRYKLSSIVGEGLLVVDGHEHKRQRRIMNPAFGTLPIRDMTEIFVTKSLELRDALVSLTDRNKQEEWTTVNMLDYVSRTTLEIIGLAGFDYSFGSVQTHSGGHESDDDLTFALGKVIHLANAFDLLSILKMFLPPFRLILWDSQSRMMRSASKTIRHVGLQLVNEKRKALQSSKEQTRAKDLLTLLIKANMNEGAGGDRNMTDEEVMNQIPTFLIAGHETTSTSVSWALYFLSMHPEFQEKLRDELLIVPTENPTMEELNSLPYLERVVRETLRYHSIVLGTTRVASQDDMIPVETPFRDKDGNLHHFIRVAKGDGIHIPIRMMNTLKEIWGPDAAEFNPDRWIDPPKASGSIPGIWGNQLSFLGGPRGCIGFRFALVEMKAILFELIRSFEFKLAVPADQIIPQIGVVTRPMVESQLEKGNQLPMLIRRIK